MANTLNIDLTGKVVVLRESSLKQPDYPPLKNLFLVGGGFGALPYTQGRMLGGMFLSDGEDTAMSGYDVERLATEEEIAALDTEWSRRFLAGELR